MSIQGITKKPNIYDLLSAMEEAQPLEAIKKIIDDPLFDINEVPQAGRAKNVTPLGIAAHIGRVDVVDELLSKGAKIIQPQTISVVQLAASQGNFDVLDRILKYCEGDEETYSILIDKLYVKLPEPQKKIVKTEKGVNIPILIEQLKKQYFINIAQRKLISKIYQWLRIQETKFTKHSHLGEFIENYFSHEGYCSALTWLFLYEAVKILLEKGHLEINGLPIFQDLRLISESDVASYIANPIYEGLLNELTILQNTVDFLSEYNQFDFVRGIGDYSVIKKFSFSEFMEVDEVVEFLPEYIPDSTMIRLDGGGHIIGLIKLPSEGEKQQLIIYDSNDPSGPKTFATMKNCAEYIKKALNPKDPFIEFTMTQYTLSNKELIDDSKEKKENESKAVELLEKIYKARITKYEADLKEYESKLKSYQAELATGVKDILEPIPPIYPYLRTQKNRGALYLACRSGNLSFVKWYLEKAFNARDLNHGLWIAAQEGYVEIVEALLLKGADYNYKYLNKTPLTQAASNGRLEVCKKIIAHVEKLNKVDPTSPYLNELFHPGALELACQRYRPEVIDLLMQKGADPSLICNEGTSLYNAIKRNQPDAVRALLKYSRKNLEQYRKKVIQYRAEHQEDINLEGFSEKASIGLLDYPLERAVKILDEKNDLLLIAAVDGREVIVEELLKAGADLNLSLNTAIVEGNINATKLLVRLGFVVPPEDLFRFEVLIELLLGKFAGKIDLTEMLKNVKDWQARSDKPRLMNDIINLIEKNRAKEKAPADPVQFSPPMSVRKFEHSSSSPQEVKQELADIMEIWTDLKDYALIIKEEMKGVRNQQLRDAMSQLVKTIESHQDTPSNDALANEIIPKVKELSSKAGVPQSVQKILNTILTLEGAKIVSSSGKTPSKKS